MYPYFVCEPFSLKIPHSAVQHVAFLLQNNFIGTSMQFLKRQVGCVFGVDLSKRRRENIPCTFEIGVIVIKTLYDQHTLAFQSVDNLYEVNFASLDVWLTRRGGLIRLPERPTNIFLNNC